MFVQLFGGNVIFVVLFGGRVIFVLFTLYLYGKYPLNVSTGFAVCWIPSDGILHNPFVDVLVK